MAKEVGTVSAYYSQISVVALQLSGKLKVGDTIAVELWRDGSKESISLKLQAAPQQ